MATRVDLFPPRWIAEFEKLHADVPPVPFEELLPELERALGRSPFEVFRDIETRAHAAASIAQVHRAKLQDGTPVVLKVRRPGVREKIDADLRLLRRVSELIESEMPEARRYQPVGDRGAVRARRSSARPTSPPRRATSSASRRTSPATRTSSSRSIYPECTSDVLLVQEHVEGIPATDPAAVDAAGLDRKLLAARGADAFLKMILIDGFFHADPHPGQRVLPAGQPHGDHRLRHGRAALAAAARAGDRPARRASRAWRRSRCSTCCSTGRATPTSTRRSSPPT